MKILKEMPLSVKNELPLIPLREIVIFPGAHRNFYVGRHESIEAVYLAKSKFDNLVFLATQTESLIENPTDKEIYDVGVVARILDVIRTPDKKVLKILIEGLFRAKITNFFEKSSYKMVSFNRIYADDGNNDDSTYALKKLITREFKKFAGFARIPGDAVKLISDELSDEALVDSVMQYLKSNIERQIALLKETNNKKRFTIIAELIYSNMESIQLEKKITLEVRKKMEQSQKEFFLNEQIKEIQKELGQSQEESELYSIDEFSKRLDTLGVPAQAKKRILKEQKRLIKMPPVSPEAGIIRNYIDWIIDLPWKNKSVDNEDLNKAKEVLDKEHYSLKKVKNRIIEFLAVRKLNPKTKGPILCFVGPPGTGKTSLAKSVADAIGREFIRISLGGVRDEAEIRGHRRTYLGAMPGKIIQSMRKVSTINPLFLLDEIDKMSSDFRGDPSSALLEVLDPEQNNQFVDHYLEIAYNLSEVMFIATANSLQGIPYPLLDRMEIIYISSYTEQEKLKIAKDFLIPREKKENGIDNIELKISQKTILEIIRAYTLEAGVRNLQRQIATACRRVAKRIVLTDSELSSVVITQKNLEKYLGRKKYIKPAMENFLDVGVSHGLAWSELGGSLLPIEIVLYKGTGKITLTGKLGDVMKESAHTAYSFIKSTAYKYNIKYIDYYKDYDVHIHFPEGAIPKDGPSGGIAITCAIISALTGVPIKSSVAMTGEITLTGKVLPIGGLREKSLAAVRHGKKEIIIPIDNERSIIDLPSTVKKKIKFSPITHAEEAFSIIFETSIYKNSFEDKSESYQEPCKSRIDEVATIQ